MQTLKIKGLKLKAPIGVYNWEKEEKRKFSVDIQLSITKSGFDDNLVNTVDYEKVIDLVKKEMSVSCNLVETIVARIGKNLLSEFEMIKELRIRVKKIKPIKGEKLKSVIVEQIFTQS